MGCIVCRSEGEDRSEEGEKDWLLDGSGKRYTVAHTQPPGNRQVHSRRFGDSRRNSHSRQSVPSASFSYTSRDSTDLQVGGSLKVSKVVRLEEEGTEERDVRSKEGQEVLTKLYRAYRWKSEFEVQSQEFSECVSTLFTMCQLHLTALSSRGDVENRREADAIVGEMVALRNYWGPQLLPSSTCNAFVRERIPLTLGVEQRQFRIDCAQYFDPVPVSRHQVRNPNEPLKLYRFTVYDIENSSCLLRYYLHRFKATVTHHVLLDKTRHVHSYGRHTPCYWDVRKHLLEEIYSRLDKMLESPNLYSQDSDGSSPDSDLKPQDFEDSQGQDRNWKKRRREHDSALCSSALSSDEDVSC